MTWEEGLPNGRAENIALSRQQVEHGVIRPEQKLDSGFLGALCCHLFVIHEHSNG